MVRKKYVVQKSFRLDAQLSNDLELLSELLQRPQNELFHFALERFMQENEHWFVSNMLQEAFELGMDNGWGYGTLLDLQYLRVDWEFVDDEKVKFTLKDGGGKISEVTYELEEQDEIKECLRNWAKGLELDDENIKAYLEKRLDYR